MTVADEKTSAIEFDQTTLTPFSEVEKEGDVDEE